jgi:iron complex transport system substrate-binding protein
MIRRFTVACLLLLAGCGERSDPVSASRNPERIIALAPNITETVYALGLEHKLVGVTTFCTYPEAARDIPRVGGFGQFNYEAMVTLNPDLVIVHEEYDTDKARLESLGIPYLETGSYFVSDIIKTIRKIGTACGAQPRAETLIRQLNTRMAERRRNPPKRARVLIAFGGSADDDIGQVHAFGTECLHNELLRIAGGQNVLSEKLPYSTLSKEAILRLNPEIIIVLAPELETIDAERSQWKRLSGVQAVEHDRVHILTGDYTCIPGPRFIQTLEDFAEIILQNNEGQNNSDMKQSSQQ